MDNNIIIVKYKGFRFDTRLVISDKEIVIEKKQGFFKRDYKVIDTVKIENIRESICDSYNLVIETNVKTYEFICKNISDSKRVKEEIIRLKQKNKIEKISNGIVKGVGTAVLVAGTIVKNRETIFKAVGTIKELFDKKG